MAKKHDFDAAWKSILEAFEVEIVELLFPEIFNKIAWNLGTESYDAKIKLASELINYDKIKNDDQIKALVDFLEYLFLIENPDLEKKYEEFKKINGGVLKMSIDDIRKLHYTEEGMEKGIEQLILKQYKKRLSIEYISEINELDVEYVRKVVTQNSL